MSNQTAQINLTALGENEMLSNETEQMNSTSICEDVMVSNETEQMNSSICEETTVSNETEQRNSTLILEDGIASNGTEQINSTQGTTKGSTRDHTTSYKRIVYQDEDQLQPRSSFPTEEGTEEVSSSVGEKKVRFSLITPVVETFIQFEDNYDFSEGGTMLKNCSQSCFYLFQDWYEHSINQINN